MLHLRRTVYIEWQLVWFSDKYEKDGEKVLNWILVVIFQLNIFLALFRIKENTSVLEKNL